MMMLLDRPLDGRLLACMDSSFVCLETIDHNFPTLAPPYSCDEFRFEDVTGLPGVVSDLSSDLSFTMKVLYAKPARAHAYYCILI